MSRKRRSVLIVIGLCVVVLLVVVVTQAIDVHPDEMVRRVAETEKPDYMSDYISENYVTFGGDTYAYSGRIETYLFMGTDHSGNEDAEGDDYRGSMADFLMLVAVNPQNSTYGMIQLNRDTMTDVMLLYRDGTEAYTQVMQLCVAHWYGVDKKQSCENTVDAVSHFLGDLLIDGYYALPMDHISELNHAVGGVTVTVEDDFSNSDPTLIEGETVTLTDEQAYHYIHDRLNVGDGENLSRMARQKQFLEAFTVQAKSLLKRNSSFANDLIDELSAYSTTDVSGNTMSRVINRLVKYESLGIHELEGETTIGQALDDGIDHTEYYVDESSILNVMTELYDLKLVENLKEGESTA